MTGSLTLMLLGLLLQLPAGPFADPGAMTLPPRKPASCDIAVKKVAEIARLAATPTAATPASVSSRIAAGKLADLLVTVQIEAAVTRIIACLNAGEPLRAWSLYSDRYLQEIIATQGGFDTALLADMATPAPRLDHEQTEVLAVTDIRVLPDGRVIATVQLRPALIPVDKTFQFIFVRQSDRWLLDDVIDELDAALG